VDSGRVDSDETGDSQSDSDGDDGSGSDSSDSEDEAAGGNGGGGADENEGNDLTMAKKQALFQTVAALIGRSLADFEDECCQRELVGEDYSNAIATLATAVEDGTRVVELDDDDEDSSMEILDMDELEGTSPSKCGAGGAAVGGGSAAEARRNDDGCTRAWWDDIMQKHTSWMSLHNSVADDVASAAGAGGGSSESSALERVAMLCDGRSQLLRLAALIDVQLVKALVEEGAVQRMERTARLLYPTSAEGARRDQLLTLVRSQCDLIAAALTTSLSAYH
jgi:hypothetical protein